MSNLDCITVLDKIVRPEIKNEKLFETIKLLFERPLYVADYATIRSRMNITYGDSTRGIVKSYPFINSHKVDVRSVFNKIPAARKVGTYTHDADQGGLLLHSVKVFEKAVWIWDELMPVFSGKIKECYKKQGCSDVSLDKWISDLRDVTLLGAFIHDIGKVCMATSDFKQKGNNLLRMHEEIGYRMIGLIWSELKECFNNVLVSTEEGYRSYMMYALGACCDKHAGYYLNATCELERSVVKLKKDILEFPAFIVCMVDKLCSTENDRNKNALYRIHWAKFIGDLYSKVPCGDYKLENTGVSKIGGADSKYSILRGRYNIVYNDKVFLLLGL